MIVSFCPLFSMSFFDLQLLITQLLSSNSPLTSWSHCFYCIKRFYTMKMKSCCNTSFLNWTGSSKMFVFGWSNPPYQLNSMRNSKEIFLCIEESFWNKKNICIFIWALQKIKVQTCLGMANFLITNLDAHICKRNESFLFKAILKKILNLRIKLKLSVALFYIYGILCFPPPIKLIATI